MEFVEEKIKAAVEDGWGWKVPAIDRVLAVNSMGNVFLRDCNGGYWRVCPEHLSAKLEAESDNEVQAVFDDPDYKADWQLLELINPAEEYFGPLKVGQCYAMIKPAVIGGDYSVSNMRVGSVYEYLSFTGGLAYKTQDLKPLDKVYIEMPDRYT